MILVVPISRHASAGRSSQRRQEELRSARTAFFHDDDEEVDGQDFETDAEYQELLDWADEFVREEVEPLDLVVPAPAVRPAGRDAAQGHRPARRTRCARRACGPRTSDPSSAGRATASSKLALLNEILGRSQWAPIVFGCQAPDTGNAEIIAHYGTAEQKERYLQPLLDGEMSPPATR